MYNPKLGTWSVREGDNFTEHFETTYYLKYNIEKALYSLNKIMKSENNYDEFSNRCVYYHFYIDNVLNAVGHIRRRFVNDKASKSRIERNKREYDYSSVDNEGNIICNYPIISSKEIRNFIEHIDEKDEKLMKLKMYNGTFNVIYKGMNKKIEKDLLSDTRKQNNLLNLITKEYNILTIKGEDNDVREYKINLSELIKELEKMKKINNSIWKYLTEKIF